jgi:hypothetical protein
MATLTVTNITETLTVNGEQPFAFGGAGMEIEVFKVAPASNAKITIGDTATITPRYISNIRAIIGSTIPVSHDLDPTAVETSVALTVTGGTSDVYSAANGDWGYVTILGRR